MALGGDGPYLVAVLWALTGLILFFLFLRLYTRIVCVAAYGVDDHFYVFTCVLIVAYSSLETVAAYHGYGQYDLDGDTIARSTYFRMLGQTFSLIATGASKATVGLFLLRLVVVRWMVIAIWVVMVIMGILSTLATIFTWAACTPVVFTWDERIPGGTCINTVPLAMGLASTFAVTVFTIVADLFFAILPWIFIWKLNIPRREKIILAVSLSLGIFAAAAGAKRIMEVKGVRDVPVGVIVWSQVETAATLVCVGIPVCRPLWTRHLSKFFKSRGSSYERQDGPSDNAPVPIGMNTFGGGTMPGAKKSGSGSRGSKKSKVGSKISSLWSVTTTSQAPRAGTEHRRGDDDNESDEINLTEEQHKGPVMSESHGQGMPMALPDDATNNPAAAGAELKRSWILGEGVNQAYVQGDESKEEEMKEGIMASRTYEIKHS
ncbi:hypothetical protein PG993_011513 [Apiospora rasikravindrae]|uniref:Rhodopsin domain-containing protein n=1 Tax=Apiospora rasikravindrae TaxID=990691 RepID=A0ABR1SGS9_9PEZI